MKKIIIYLGLALLIISCGNKKNIPDVSDIQVNLKLERFDQDFFRLDSNNLATGLKQLQTTYPAFYIDYMQGLLGVSGDANDSLTKKMAKVILGDYASLYAAASQKLAATPNIENDLKKGFQFVKYYFPNYKVPGIITFLATLDAPGMVITEQYLAIGLHQYAGKDFPAYQTQQVRQLYPDYISRRFEPVYIPANCMKAVVQDLFPDKSSAKPLIEQMIEKGKQWWLLDKFMPEAPDSVKTGYTQKQLDWCHDNEGLIWSYIIKTENLYSVEPVTIQTYIGEGPFTQGFSQEYSPGNLGAWIGWQIVKKYEGNNPDFKPEEIMKASSKEILEKAKYKPK